MRLKYLKYDVKYGLRKVKTKTAVLISSFALVMGGGGGLALSLLHSAGAATPNWNLNSAYTFDFDYLGTSYIHDATISGQNSGGDFAISGGYPAGGSYSFAWSGTGNIDGSNVSMSTDYTVGAVGTHMDMTGTVGAGGVLSGTWTDNYGGGTRSGTWTAASGTATAISQVVVTPLDTQGWLTADTRTGGAVNFVVDSSAPGNPHIGALGLTTDSTNAAKAQYMHGANIPLADVSMLGYSTKQNAANFDGGDASYQLPVCLEGFTAPVTPANPSGCNGYTTLVYEPYENGTVTPGVWQSWNVAAGQLWSSRTAGTGTCSVTAGSGGAPFYTLSNLKANCPTAVVVGFGVNIGSYNPSYNIETDLVNFNGTIYNFEPAVVTSKEQCKNDGWKVVVDANGNSFRNQGLCVSYVASNGKSQH